MTTGTIEWSDNLRRGIWPRSAMIWVIAFWTALLIIRPWEKLTPWMQGMHPERTYALFALTILFTSGAFRMLPSLQTAGLMVWFLASVASFALALQPSLAWDKLYVLMTVFAFFFSLLSAIRTTYQLLFVITCFLISTALFLAKSQWEFFLNGAHGFAMGVYRLQGMNTTYGHPNAVSGLAVISLPLWLVLWQSRHDFARSWPGLWRRAFVSGLAMYPVLAVTSIIETNSRTGVLGFIVFVALVTMGRWRLQRVIANLAIGVAVLGTLWMIMPEANRHRVQTIWAPTEKDKSAVESAEGRKVGVQLGLEMFRRFPLTGVGLGNFPYYRQSFLDGDNHVAHNTYAALLAETGLVGAAGFAFFIFGIFVNARRTNRIAKAFPDPTIQLLAKLTVACRRATLLVLFVGLAGDYQGFAPLYWIAAYCLLSQYLASRIAHRLKAHHFTELAKDAEESWEPSYEMLSTG